MAKRGRRKARKSRGLRGVDFITALGGEIFTCSHYSKGPRGKVRCDTFKARKGKPSAKARKRAGIKGKYRYNSKKAAAWRKKRGAQRAAFGTRSSGVNGLGRVRRGRKRK